MSNAQDTGQREYRLLTAETDTTEELSQDPHIVVSDTRYPGAPCFLYIPPGPGQANLVVVDYYAVVRTVASYAIWQTPPTVLPQPPCFRIQAIPGKGFGMVATRRINRAELIVAERPVYAARRSLSCAADQSNANGVFYRAALEGLSEEARMAILQLHNAYPRASVDYVPGILNTNCLEIQVVEKQDPAESYVGCFPTLSRVNHDCTPSAHYFFDFGRFEGQLRAMRNIEEGEEITMTYTDVCLPFVERQNFLARTRYFTCRCRACCLTGQEKEASEARRAAIADITNRLDTVRFPEEVPYERLQAVLDGAREEGLVHQYAQVLMLGSQVLTIYGDLRIAIDWAQRAKQLFVMIEGESSPNVKTLTEAERVHRAMVNAPRSMRLPRLS